MSKSKKQEFLHQQQSRDRNPEKLAKGSGAEVSSRGAQAKGNPADHQVPHSGKVANDHNRQGQQAPTQKNEAQRTPDSRHDRDNHLGGSNQLNSRKGGRPGGGAG